MESILITIKKLLGIMPDDNNFDTDIIIHINSVFLTLNQLGIGPKEVFRIEDDISVWSDFVETKNDIEAIKTYMYLKVKMLFDNTLNTSVVESLNRMANEYEWRLMVQEDNIDDIEDIM